MTRNTKIILGVAAGLILLTCLCVGTIAAGITLFTVRTVSTDASRVELAAERVGAVVPQGWRTDYTVHIGEIEVVGYRPEAGDGHLVFAYFGPDFHANVEELAADIQSMTGSHYQWMRDEMTVVERRKVLLGDQEATVVISESVGSGGAWRQAMIGYQGERGFTAAMLGLPAAAWSEEKLDEFINALN